MRARKSRVPVGLVLAGLLVAFWALLAPSQLGGPTTFTATVGNSMEPMFHKGDLALTRQSPLCCSEGTCREELDDVIDLTAPPPFFFNDTAPTEIYTLSYTTPGTG